MCTALMLWIPSTFIVMSFLFAMVSSWNNKGHVNLAINSMDWYISYTITNSISEKYTYSSPPIKERVTYWWKGLPSANVKYLNVGCQSTLIKSETQQLDSST